MRAIALVLLLPALLHAQDIVPKDAKLEKLWSEGEFTEGPAYGPGPAIYFSDIGNRIMKFDEKTGKTSEYRNPSGRANGNKFDAQGRLVTCEGANKGGNRRISITNKDGAVVLVADNWMDKKFNSPNDLVIDVKGRIYLTDPRYVGSEKREIDTESVYRIDPPVPGARSGRYRVTQIISDVKKPNGIVIAPDQKTLYLADSPGDAKGKRLLLSYALSDDGVPSNKKILHDFGADRGIDGMAIDVKGNLYATAGRGKTAGVTIFA